MLVVIPAVVTAISAPLPAPIKVGSKSSVSAPYPEPPVIISALVTAPPATVTLAVAPSQVVVPSLNSLTF